MELEYLDLEDIYENAQNEAAKVLKERFYPDFIESDTLKHFVKSLQWICVAKNLLNLHQFAKCFM